MDFLNQPWFWTGFFAVAGAIVGPLITARYNIKLEKIKLYNSEKFKAYNTLYSFIADANVYLWPPDERRKDFIRLMKKKFYPDVKSKFLYFDSEIGEELKKIEIQYECLSDDDFIPPIDQDLFLNDTLIEMLNGLQIKAEKVVDKLTK